MFNFNDMATSELLDWYFQYASPRQAGFYRNVPRRKAERVILERLGVIPRDPRVMVIARGAVPGTYTWETR